MTAAAASRDRYRGCLIGQCLGDALGFIVEGEAPPVSAAYVEQVLKGGRAHEGRRGPFPFGQYSDDSQLARELMQSYAARRRFDAADYASRIAAIFAEGRIVGRGRATEEAAQRLAAGVPWQGAGTPPPSAGNGSAMRAGPIGLMFPGGGEALVRAAVDQGRITHTDPRCAAGAVAIAGAVSLALNDTPPSLFPERLAAWADPLDPGTAGALRELNRWLELSPAEAAGPISRAGLEPGYRDAWQGISPFVVGSVMWSLYAFLKSPDDYWDSICTAIAVGGDVDTTAAMTGAIAGARNGLGAVPADLARRLNDNGGWAYDDLVGLADRIWDISSNEGEGR